MPRGADFSCWAVHLLSLKEVIVRVLITTSTLLPVVLVLSSCQPEVGPLSEQDIAAIRDLGEREVVEALLAEDWDRFAATFTEDAVRMPPNEPLHQGRQAIRDWAETNWGPLTLAELTQTMLDVDGRGDVAYTRGSYSATSEVSGLSEPVSDVGKVVAILRRQDDGRWLISVAIYNSDLPLPPMEGEHSEAVEPTEES
jgi:uncharacterized protein (TIGR02246 family)